MRNKDRQILRYVYCFCSYIYNYLFLLKLLRRVAFSNLTQAILNNSAPPGAPVVKFPIEYISDAYWPNDHTYQVLSKLDENSRSRFLISENTMTTNDDDDGRSKISTTFSWRLGYTKVHVHAPARTCRWNYSVYVSIEAGLCQFKRHETVQNITSYMYAVPLFYLF